MSTAAGRHRFSLTYCPSGSIRPRPGRVSVNEQEGALCQGRK